MLIFFLAGLKNKHSNSPKPKEHSVPVKGSGEWLCNPAQETTPLPWIFAPRRSLCKPHHQDQYTDLYWSWSPQKYNQPSKNTIKTCTYTGPIHRPVQSPGRAAAGAYTETQEFCILGSRIPGKARDLSLHPLRRGTESRKQVVSFCGPHWLGIPIKFAWEGPNSQGEGWLPSLQFCQLDYSSLPAL